MYCTNEEREAISSCLDRLPPAIRSRCIVRHFDKGELMYQKGDPIRCAYWVCCGRIRSINIFRSGETLSIQDNYPQDFLGDIAILAEERSASVSAYALTDCVTIQIPRQDFLSWMRGDAAFCFQMLRRISSTLYHSTDTRGRELFYPPADILTIFLSDYGQTHFEKQLGYARVEKTRVQLSEELGLTVKTINRAVSKLKESGFLHIRKGKICMDRKQIELLSEQCEDLQ